MEYPLISIIVPVYNVESFCRKCFDSLLAIDYKSKELILVDDCGADDSGHICDDYAVKHKEITVIHHQNNSGVTQSRITGLNHAHGEYIMFVDADDYVQSDILLNMIGPMLSNNADMVCCQIYKVYGNATKSIETRSIFGVFDEDGIKDLLSKILLHDESIKRSGMPLYLCGKLFKRDVLEDALQQGLGLNFEEDLVAVLYMLIYKIKSMVILEAPYYYYIHHDTQVTSKKLHELWPSLVKVWNIIDNMDVEGFSSQLTNRIWNALKPSIYDKPSDWGGIIRKNKYVPTFRDLRNSGIVKKYIWNNRNLPREIKRHPHYLLLKYRFYKLDYILYIIIWFIRKIVLI